jgi:hypothetical protein
MGNSGLVLQVFEAIMCGVIANALIYYFWPTSFEKSATEQYK